jgi:putative redox protein
MSTGNNGAGRLTVVTGEGGLRFAADVRGHTIRMDQPIAGGGLDSAPSPLELLAVSLGGCIALYATQYCATRGLPHEGIRVEVGTQTAKGPYRIASFGVAVHLPEPLAEEHHLPLHRALLACPAHNTLAHPPAMEIRLVEPALTGDSA